MAEKVSAPPLTEEKLLWIKNVLDRVEESPDTMTLLWMSTIRRLEAAESVVTASFDPFGKAYIGYDDWHEKLAEWRKTAGRE